MQLPRWPYADEASTDGHTDNVDDVILQEQSFVCGADDANEAWMSKGSSQKDMTSNTTTRDTADSMPPPGCCSVLGSICWASADVVVGVPQDQPHPGLC